MSTLPEIDLTDPGYIRHCLRPDCTAWFNIAYQMTGGPYVEGWHMVRMFSLDYLCPQHSRRVANGDHAPGWIWDGGHGQVLGVRCACEWAWEPGRSATNGEHREQWAGHLIQIDP